MSASTNKIPLTVRLDRLRVGAATLGATLEPGRHVFWGTPRDGTAELIAHLAGASLMRRGTVQVGGIDPLRSPSTRCAIASLLHDEPPLEGHTVSEHFALAGRARGIDAKAPSFVAPLLERPSGTLDERERRLVALGLALSHPQPRLVALHEPFALCPPAGEAELWERLDTWEKDGAVVVCATADRKAAQRIGGRLWSLSGKTFSQDEVVELLVRVDAARSLAARLAEHPAADAVAFDATRPRDVRVRGANLEALAVAVQESVLAEKCALFELTPLYFDAEEAGFHGTNGATSGGRRG